MNLKLYRKPLAPGNIYVNPHDTHQKFKVTNMALPGTEWDDNGAPGVAIKWIGFHGFRLNGWDICESENEFWTMWMVDYFISPEFLSAYLKASETEDFERQTMQQIGAGI